VENIKDKYPSDEEEDERISAAGEYCRMVLEITKRAAEG